MRLFMYICLDVHVCLNMKNNNLSILQSLIASEGLTYGYWERNMCTLFLVLLDKLNYFLL